MNISLVQKTKVLAGSGCSVHTGELLKSAGYRKAFVVYDQGIAAAGIPEQILKSLREQGICYICFDGVRSDPPARVVDHAAQLCRAEGCDCVVAIGGGSSIDTAKGVTILRFNEGKILDYGNPDVPMNVCSGLISIPTTSGTGSELSDGLIITDTEHESKVPILALAAMSEYAVLDPLLTLRVPERMTVACGLDVFSHAFETYTSARANILTEPISEKIMELSVKALPVLMEEPENIRAREQMAAASMLGGWMLAQASAHVGHSVAHVLGAHFHMVHGEACAYGLPGVMKLISDAVPEKLNWTAELLGESCSGAETPEELGRKAADAYTRFRDVQLGLAPVSTYGPFDRDYVRTVCADAVMSEPFRNLSPVPVSREAAVVLLEDALQL